MLSVLRAKGLLGEQHGADVDAFEEISDSEGGGGGNLGLGAGGWAPTSTRLSTSARADHEGSGSEGGGAYDLDGLGWVPTSMTPTASARAGGWHPRHGGLAAGAWFPTSPISGSARAGRSQGQHQPDSDHGDVLERVLSDLDYSSSSHGSDGSNSSGGGGGGVHHGDGIGGDDDPAVKDGWAIEHLERLLRAADLGAILQEMVADVIPRLVNDPADPATLRRHGREIRRLGKDLPGLMGQPPVTLGNYVQKVASKGLKLGPAGGGAEWIDQRRGRILARVMPLYEGHRVRFHY